ncbi:alpha/beta fold hydrolase [Sphingomicrobium nitratireducens]|uniref:alpha/beta fold hydrolase n=1 Tax=Sphingomicrobium nitratireducens TaxID=2964666 RepID=UPI002240BB31|nr:alpha/beta hydrolase [Sphingomicrobium nitratireducens]
MTTPSDARFHDLADGRRLAFRLREGHAPTLLFLPGYASDMDGGKATALDDWCARNSLACLRFDYSGTGLSDGEFADGTLARWHDEVLAMIDEVAPPGPILLAGSSMGGWLALHAAIARPDRVKALLGIAAAPDFTDWGFTPEQKATILSTGKLEEPNPYGPEPYVTHKGFFEAGEAMKLLGDAIPFEGPVRFVHGAADADVPYRIAIAAMERLATSDVQLRLIKKAGHRLSEPHEIDAILSEASALLDTIA